MQVDSAKVDWYSKDGNCCHNFKDGNCCYNIDLGSPSTRSTYTCAVFLNISSWDQESWKYLLFNLTVYEMTFHTALSSSWVQKPDKNVITAACVLHNICKTHNEHFNEAWMQSSNEEYEQPTK